MIIKEFHAAWCGPCKAMKPILEEVEKELGVTIEKIDIETEKGVNVKYGIMSIPTLIILEDDEEVDRATGYKPKEAIVELIKKWI